MSNRHDDLVNSLPDIMARLHSLEHKRMIIVENKLSSMDETILALQRIAGDESAFTLNDRRALAPDTEAGLAAEDSCPFDFPSLDVAETSEHDSVVAPCTVPDGIVPSGDIRRKIEDIEQRLAHMHQMHSQQAQLSTHTIESEYAEIGAHTHGLSLRDRMAALEDAFAQSQTIVIDTYATSEQMTQNINDIVENYYDATNAYANEVLQSTSDSTDVGYCSDATPAATAAMVTTQPLPIGGPASSASQPDCSAPRGNSHGSGAKVSQDITSLDLRLGKLEHLTMKIMKDSVSTRTLDENNKLQGKRLNENFADINQRIEDMRAEDKLNESSITAMQRECDGMLTWLTGTKEALEKSLHIIKQHDSSENRLGMLKAHQHDERYALETTIGDNKRLVMDCFTDANDRNFADLHRMNKTHTATNARIDNMHDNMK